MREKLENKYPTEREQVCEELINLLNLDENNSFLLSDLDDDIAKQNQILNMRDKIRPYFSVGQLAPFRENAECKRPCIVLLRGILRMQGYKFTGKSIILEANKGKVTTRYSIHR